MEYMSSPETVVKTDVLVIGGGMAGLVAAIEARKKGLEVLIVDKARVGFAGMPSRAGNGLLTLDPKRNDIDDYVAYLVRNLGCYLTDQDAQYQWANMNREVTEALRSYGVKITETENGDIGYFPHPCGKWSVTGIELNCTESMRKYAVKNGVKIRNCVQITSLLKKDGRVCGAVGFEIHTGEFFIFEAKVVVSGCAAFGARSVRMFTGRGEGVKLAWEAGAQMRNAEYGNFVEIISDQEGESIYGTERIIYNRLGENVWDKYVKWDAPDVVIDMITGMEKEYAEGRGPLYVDFSKMSEEMKVIGQSGGTLMGMTRFFPDKLRWMGATADREHAYIDIGPKPTVKTGFHGNAGPVRVDLNMKTTVPGLYVIGIDSCNGSGVFGSFPQPAGQRGSGLGYALYTGYVGGQRAAEEALGIESIQEADTEQIAEKKASAFACLNRPEGVSAYSVIEKIQSAILPYRFCIMRSDASIRESLSILDGIRKDVAQLKASDLHELMICNETAAMALTVELMMRSALVRTESRGFHRRSDYPETDNRNWLKWVVADNIGGEMVISTEDIPMDRYRIKPEN